MRDLVGILGCSCGRYVLSDEPVEIRYRLTEKPQRIMNEECIVLVRFVYRFELGANHENRQWLLSRKSPVAFVCSFTVRIKARHRRGISGSRTGGLKRKSKLLSVCHFVLIFAHFDLIKCFLNIIKA